MPLQNAHYEKLLRGIVENQLRRFSFMVTTSLTSQIVDVAVFVSSEAAKPVFRHRVTLNSGAFFDFSTIVAAMRALYGDGCLVKFSCLLVP